MTSMNFNRPIPNTSLSQGQCIGQKKNFVPVDIAAKMCTNFNLFMLCSH